MSTQQIIQNGKVIGIVTVADIYRFEGFLFEYSRTNGIVKLKADGSPAAREGIDFRKAVRKWHLLPAEEKEATRIG